MILVASGADNFYMNVNYLQLIMGVIKDFRVIATIVAALMVIEFAKFVTSYKKKPPKAKKPKAVKAAPPPPPAPEASGTEGGDGGSSENAES